MDKLNLNIYKVLTLSKASIYQQIFPEVLISVLGMIMWEQIMCGLLAHEVCLALSRNGSTHGPSSLHLLIFLKIYEFSESILSQSMHLRSTIFPLSSIYLYTYFYVYQLAIYLWICWSSIYLWVYLVYVSTYF